MANTTRINSAAQEEDSFFGISDDELTRRFCIAIELDNLAKKAKGVPIAGYDPESQRSFLEYPDGKRVYGRAAADGLCVPNRE